MLFNSIEFLIFFPVVTILYFLLEHRYRWMLLLAASCYFYMAFRPIYILILAFTIVIDYYAGILIEESTAEKKKRYLILSIFANVGVLAVFKYYNFFAAELNTTFNTDTPLLNILLPVGLSFHTFQAMSYTFEVYRGNQKAERHFGIYSLYVMFYPQLVAGPIERPQNILHQFYIKHKFDYEQVRSGLLLMAWGMFKKVVIADRLAIFVNQVFDYPTQYSGPSLVVAAVFFSFQIFCDFSGYSDIAIGSAQVMGFTLMKNFDRPYSSKSISEFWRRWHISLSTWFRDYLYIPLGGNRVGRNRALLNLFIVFLVSGLWHGANWNYIIWGALHGFYLVFALVTQKPRTYIQSLVGMDRVPWLHNGIQVLTTFVLVTFAWIFFRADYYNTDIMWNLVKSLGKGWPSVQEFFSTQYFMENICLGQKRRTFFTAIALIVFMEMVHHFQKKNSLRLSLSYQPLWVRWSFYSIFVLAILYLGVFDNTPQFIYFQF
ncbi:MULTISPECIES: MBOAT family protein [Dyadobacter]|uniref:MBOAT family protein n=1 Tax=Dyadobacter chenhuakuii TaxID=2909339 RepID=A0A9X1QDK0_9BACT|nr:MULTISPECIES: MBOAT family O-acyltransferase [Dyadobacter]MCE7072999.1 MBOAT family protein [Dyadobacter sp. CY327]MCF2499131.1 MBOAT family protein [Dyadobacter chenhuakuii]MCF2517550.1 MBOAT family protein [Dyadobacter sp. CY351]